MMTPIIKAAPGTSEVHYNNMQMKARSTVQRAIGLLKARFRCLLVHRILHYSPLVAGSIVNACVILHNICNRANLLVEELNAQETAEEAQLQAGSSTHPSDLPSASASTTSLSPSPATSTTTELDDGVAARRALVIRLWMPRQI